MPTATAPAAIAPPGEEKIQQIPVGAFKRRPQVRKHFEERALAGLAQSMIEQGVLYPLLCYLDQDDIVIIDGERRWRAASMVGIATLPARILHDKLTIAEALARQLSCNLQREPLDPIEKAEGIQQFIQTSGLSGKDAARRLGMEPSALCRALGPLKLPQALRDRIVSGAISSDAGYLLSRVADPAMQAALADRAESGELTRDQLAKTVRAVISGRPPRPLPLNEQLVRTPADSVPGESGMVASWRITRTIAPGVALAVTGTTGSIGDLLNILEQFIQRGRSACASGMKLPKFLAEFRRPVIESAPAKGVTA